MDIISLILVLVLGLIAGSFTNSVIFRMNDLMSIVRHRSHCPHCKKNIEWYDLIPLFSFVVLAGKCRKCAKKISFQYPIVELGMAILYILIYINFGITVYSVFLMILSIALLSIFVYDLKNMIIPDIMIVFSLILWVVIWILSLISNSFGLPSNFVNLIIGGFVSGIFIAIIVLITQGKGMGIGDIKLAFLLGFMIGYPNTIVMLFLAFIIGAMIGLFLLLTKIKKLKSEIPFAPFLIIGFYLSLFYADKIINWYTMR